MYDLRVPENIWFYMLYAGVATLAVIAGFYLLFRKGNAFATEITSSKRLRRWTAAFFFSTFLSHVWYMPATFYTSPEDRMLFNTIGGLLDSLLVIPLAINVMLCMLQDRRRPLWTTFAMVAPLVAIFVYGLFNPCNIILPLLYITFLLLGIGFIIYMVHAVKQYGRWLRNNYADLEHKEVWQSFVVLAFIFLLFSFYIYGIGWSAYEYIVQVSGMLLVCYLLWRVETLSDLSISQSLALPAEEETAAEEEQEDNSLPQAINDKMAPLLQQHCIDTQLYLQYDLSVSQLAHAIGTNRSYLSQYFSQQGTSYNAYINNLRINHFVNLYRETVAAKRPFTAQQLALESGYHSYSTFSLAFKQRMGQTVTTWMRDTTV